MMGMDPDLAEILAESNAELAQMLADMHAAFVADMQPFWAEQQRRDDEVAELLAEMAPPIRPAWFD